MSIEITNLTKQFGEKTAVDGLTLRIDGGMYGLLGPNGAGKTTLMRILCTLLTPTSGQVKMDGVPLDNKVGIRRLIGYLPQDFSFYPNFTVEETLDYLGMLSEMKDRKVRAARIDELLTLTNLSHNRRAKVAKLSGGMRRRLGIAQVLLADPSIIIVDEPTAGLDPEERIRFRNLLGTVAGGKTVLLSTHIAEDVRQTCANVAVMNAGRLLFAGNVQSLTEQARGRVWRTIVEGRALSDLQRRYAVVAMVPTAEGYDVRVVADEKPSPDAEPEAPGLEDAYMLLVKGGGAHAPGMV